MGIAVPVGWLWFVILCRCVVLLLMLKETACLLEAAGISPCVLERVSRHSAVFPILFTDQKVEGKKCIRNSSVLMAQLSTECECCGCCWSAASPAPALGVTGDLQLPACHCLSCSPL